MNIFPCLIFSLKIGWLDSLIWGVKLELESQFYQTLARVASLSKLSFLIC